MLDVRPELFEFVDAHKGDDPVKLRFKFHGNEDKPWIDMAISHIECVRKAGKKFGRFQPELMVLPLSIEQATSARVAEYHAEIASKLIGHRKCRLLDMTCGLGIDLMALSESLDCEAIGIELQKNLADVTDYNFRNKKNVTIINADSVEWLSESELFFDIIFIDPARRGDCGERVYNIHDCRPDVVELLPLFAEHCRFLMVKLSPMLDVTQTLRDLPQTKELYVIDEGNECREIFAVIDFKVKNHAAEISVISDSGKLMFKMDDEVMAVAKLSSADEGMFLFEPSPAMMKAKAFSLLCEKLNIGKLHPNTNLFVADKAIDGLPGKWYVIDRVFDLSSSKLKEIGKMVLQADVAVRNHRMSPEELTKRLKIKAGGGRRLMCCTVGCNDGTGEKGALLLLTRYRF